MDLINDFRFIDILLSMSHFANCKVYTSNFHHNMYSIVWLCIGTTCIHEKITIHKLWTNLLNPNFYHYRGHWIFEKICCSYHKLNDGWYCHHKSSFVIFLHHVSQLIAAMVHGLCATNKAMFYAINCRNSMWRPHSRSSQRNPELCPFALYWRHSQFCLWHRTCTGDWKSAQDLSTHRLMVPHCTSLLWYSCFLYVLYCVMQLIKVIKDLVDRFLLFS